MRRAVLGSKDMELIRLYSDCLLYTSPILPEHWQMVVGKDKKKQFDILKKLMNAPDVTEVCLLYTSRKAWTAPGKDRGQHSQSSCNPSKAATLPDQQLLCRIKAAGNAR